MNIAELDRLENELPQKVKELRGAIQDKHGVWVPNHCDDFLKRCLRVKEFDQGESSKLAMQIKEMLNEMVKFCGTDLYPSISRPIFDAGLVTVLTEADHLGRRMTICKPGLWVPKEMKFDELVTALWLIAQYATYEHVDIQRHGIVSVWDFSNFSMQHAMNINHRLLRNALMWMQNSTLARFKELHIIFHPRIVSVIYSAVKPFLNEKIKKRIHFHGYDIKSLHKHVDPALLPPYLGGTGKVTESTHDKAFMDGFYQQDHYFKEWILAESGFPTK